MVKQHVKFAAYHKSPVSLEPRGVDEDMKINPATRYNSGVKMYSVTEFCSKPFRFLLLLAVLQQNHKCMAKHDVEGNGIDKLDTII